MFEFKTIAISGHPDKLLASVAVDDWDLVSVVPGAFDREGRYSSIAFTCFFRRPLIMPDPDGENVRGRRKRKAVTSGR